MLNFDSRYSAITHPHGTLYLRHLHRDSDIIIIVYWDPGTDASKRPADGAKCWMFVSRLNNWDENY